MVIDGFVPSGNLTYSHGKSPWKWAMASMGGWVYWTIGMCHDAFLDVALTMVGMRCAMNIINYIYIAMSFNYSFWFHCYRCMWLCKCRYCCYVHVHTCFHSYFHSYIVVDCHCYQTWGIHLPVMVFRVARRGASSKAAEEKKNHGTGGESPAEPYGWWLTPVG